MATTLPRSTTARRSSLQSGRVPTMSIIFRWAAILLVLFIVLFPFLYAVTTSFKTTLASYDGTVIPFLQYQPTLANWQNEFGSGGPETVKAISNSTLIAVSATIFATSLGTLAGYGLGRFKYPIGNRNLVMWFLSQRFLPPIATVIPFVLMFRSLRLLDTALGMTIVNTTFTLPFAVLIMRDFFAEFPRDLQDAALVDSLTYSGGWHSRSRRPRWSPR
jgi:multiple sugar transport system permease protein